MWQVGLRLYSTHYFPVAGYDVPPRRPHVEIDPSMTAGAAMALARWVRGPALVRTVTKILPGAVARRGPAIRSQYFEERFPEQVVSRKQKREEEPN